MRPVPSWPFLSPVSRSFAREGEREALALVRGRGPSPRAHGDGRGAAAPRGCAHVAGVDVNAKGDDAATSAS